MNDAAKKFVERWRGRGSEKGEAQLFWVSLLRDLFSISQPESFIKFEVPVNLDGSTAFIDALIPSTKVLIENKSRGIDLDKPAKQSDGFFLTPFQQAKRYADALPYSRRPRWIVTCNFVELRIFDMDRRDENYRPAVVLIERLPYEFARLNFLVDPDDENVNPALKISKQAGEIVGLIYRSFQLGMRNAELGIKEFGRATATQGGNRFLSRAPSSVGGSVDGAQNCVAPLVDTHQTGAEDWAGVINRFCVRLVFCLYAEDSFIFERNQFTDYLRQADDRRAALFELFNVLNTPPDRRDPNLRADLKQFPFVNGDLFAGADPVPDFSVESVHWLLTGAHDFNWSGISPTIFGALFESTLNPLTRRTGGMHYTSIENIHRVIDPLFLDDLHDEFQSIKRKKKNRRIALEKFQFKIAALTFLDPACGSGNFLTETYLSLRRLENEVIRELYKLGARCSIRISIENFFGIEINDFAVAVARTALWIAENQMLQETEMIIHEDINFLPLTSAAHIVEGNALTVDWKKIAPRGVDYIIGNPPFVGTKYQTAQQKSDVLAVCKALKALDYVTCWFKKAADFMRDNQTRAAFVATNSITQGEQVAPLWKACDAHIDFARRTFKWLSESDDMAAVHCVVIGFSVAPNDKPRIIFDGDQKIIAANINGYLLDAPNVFIENRTKALCDVPKMFNGNVPLDGDALKIEADDYDAFIRREPRAKKYIRRLIGGRELINGEARYVLWLADATAEDLKLPLIAERVELCRQRRLAMTDKGSIKLAATPTTFRDTLNPDQFIAVPRVSSERRRYIPMGFFDGGTIATNQVLIIPNADLYHFGVLESSVHMAWTRVVCGRLEMRYRYSAHIVYNNFPWCARTPAIERAAQKILDARALYPSRSLASLYNDETMPEELRAAHLENDAAVLDAYGFARNLTEAQIVARLIRNA